MIQTTLQQNAEADSGTQLTDAYNALKTSAGNAYDSIMDVGNQIVTPAASAAKMTAGVILSPLTNATKSILGINLEDLIFILVGLLLLAAGLFAFKTTQNVINKTVSVGTKVGKHVAELGEVAAA